MNTALGHDPLSAEAPWEVVCEKMGRTRTTTQCRKKWYVIERSDGGDVATMATMATVTSLALF